MYSSEILLVIYTRSIVVTHERLQHKTNCRTRRFSATRSTDDCHYATDKQISNVIVTIQKVLFSITFFSSTIDLHNDLFCFI